MPANFSPFFRDATGNTPYDYQRRLAGGDADRPSHSPADSGTRIHHTTEHGRLVFSTLERLRSHLQQRNTQMLDLKFSEL